MRLNMWLVIGFLAQSLFFLRFAVQWVASERRKQSVIPVSFWYLSLAGGVGLLAYALHIKDPVFIAGHCFGVVVYLRNLYFVHRKPGQPTPLS